MLKTIFIALMSFNLLFSNGSGNLLTDITPSNPKANTGTLEKMIPTGGSVAMDIDLSKLNKSGSRKKNSDSSALRFEIANDSFFTVLVFNNELRGPLPSSLSLASKTSVNLPARLNASQQNLVIESLPFGGPYELAVRDGKTGFVFFYIEGHIYDYEPANRLFSFTEGRLLISKEFADELGRPAEVGTVAGQISLSATMRPIEVTQLVDDEVTSTTLPANTNPNAGSIPGPDVIVGDVNGLSQFGSNGTQVGLALGTDSCNLGTVELNWFQNPNNDHPAIPQNLYRMSGGADNNERFEQIGQSSVKHAFTALQNNLCGLGCASSGTGTRLGSGCSDPYSAGLNSGGSGNTLGSRAWINPFTGAFPRNDSATPNNSHAGHSHNGTSHRILTNISDLNTTVNPGATYYAEGQYITPHEYAWCQSNPGQCNMYNNVSYRRYNVTGTSSFSFSAAAATVRTRPAISAWTGAKPVTFEPAPGVDGTGIVAYKVTNTGPGVWHYEYAVYNQNLDRAIQFFRVNLGPDVSLTNIGFHAPPQHPAWANDGTTGSTGYSSTPWNLAQSDFAIVWSTETFAQNPNANAIRWGTMYNFRFDSNRPPQFSDATVGFFKTGAPVNVQVLAPSGCLPAACRQDF